MPFNQLILPLLGGYLLITYANCFIYWTSRQSKEHLIFASAFAGAILAIVARAIALLIANTEFGGYLYNFVHDRMNYEGIGTATLALLLGGLLVVWINRAWPAPEAGLWLYGRGVLSQLEALFFASFNGSIPAEGAVFRSLPVELFLRLGATIPILGKLFQKQLRKDQRWMVITSFDEGAGRANPAPIMVSMKDRKVYVGLLQHAPSMKATGMSHLNLEVLLSGYRDKDDLSVIFTDDYTAIFAQNQEDCPEDVEDKFNPAEEMNDGQTLPSFKVLPVSEILSASFFDVSIFEKFQKRRAAGTESTRERERDLAPEPHLLRRVFRALFDK